MCGMAGFDPEYSVTCRTARSVVILPVDLSASFWRPLNDWVDHLLKDISTLKSVKLLAFLGVLFLQDSAILREKSLEAGSTS